MTRVKKKRSKGTVVVLHVVSNGSPRGLTLITQSFAWRRRYSEGGNDCRAVPWRAHRR